MNGLAHVGISLHGILFLALAAVCTFDDGAPAPDWTDCLIPLGLLVVPLALAVAGLRRGSPRMLTAAAVVGALFGLVSLAGPGLFVVVPAILYGMSARRRV